MFALDINKLFEVSDKDRAMENTNYEYKILNTIKDNWQLVGSIILIIMIWYYFNYLDTYYTYQPTKIIQSGGIGESYMSSVKSRGASLERVGSKEGRKSIRQNISKGVSKKVDSLGKAAYAAPSKASSYIQRHTDSFKVMSGGIYQIVFQIAMLAMMFIIFGPALALFAIMMLCFVVLKQKILYVKEL
jgi:hypothetical protein